MNTRLVFVCFVVCRRPPPPSLKHRARAGSAWASAQGVAKGRKGRGAKCGAGAQRNLPASGPDRAVTRFTGEPGGESDGVAGTAAQWSRDTTFLGSAMSTIVHCCLVCCVDGSEGRWKEVLGVWWGEAASAKPMGGKTI